MVSLLLTACGSTVAGVGNNLHNLTGTSLTAMLTRGTEGISSAHVTFAVTVGRTTLSGSGDERISDNKLQSMDVVEQLPGMGTIDVLVDGGAVYVRNTQLAETVGKPWIAVPANSSNPQLHQMMTQLRSLLGSGMGGGAPSSYDALGTAATSLRKVGTQTVGGSTTTEYSVTVDPSRPPSSIPFSREAKRAGVSDVPVDIWVDSSGRPVRVTMNFTAEQQPVSVISTVSEYNAPVHIVAPPASEIFNGG